MSNFSLIFLRLQFLKQWIETIYMQYYLIKIIAVSKTKTFQIVFDVYNIFEY